MTVPVQKIVLIMAGGTGGHVFPALAVANDLRARDYRIVWLGTHKGIEARLVPAAGIEIEWLPVGGLRGKGVMTLLTAPWQLVRAMIAAWKVFKRVQPAVVLGMGGFASGPGGIVSRLTRRPLVIHEQNAIAGFTNRVLARFAAKVLVAFPDTLPDEEVVGNPVRDDVLAIEAPEQRFAGREGPLRVLVLGGSLGARALNETVPAALVESGLSLDVWHQCGRGDEEDIRRRYAERKIAARVDAFIDDVAAAYAWADVAVCRAGAMTVFELAAAGLGAVLVPFPYAVDDHQTANAKYLADAGAGLILQESELDVASLAVALRDVCTRERLLRMATSARRKSQPGATQHVATSCARLAEMYTGGAA